MTEATPHPRLPMLTRVQRLGVAVFCVLFVATEVVTVSTSLRSSRAEDAYEQHMREAGEAADLVRGLGLATIRSSETGRLDDEDVALAVATGRRHLQVLEARAQKDTTSLDAAELAAVTAALEDFDRLAATSPSDVVAGRELLVTAETMTKHQYDVAELAALDDVDTLAQTGRLADYLGIALAALTLVFGSALLLSVARRFRGAYADAYEKLAERTDELRRHSDELEAANHRLVEADRAKDGFISVVSHELRTPLTAIRGFTETLLRHRAHLTEEQQDIALGRILRQAMRQQRLVEDLLTAARLQDGPPETVRRRVDLGALVTRQAADMAAAVTVVVRDETPAALADPEHVERIVANLLTNAAKYGGDTVDVEIASRRDRVVISVRDDGPGIPEDFQPRLFAPFAQADEGDRRTATGFGLGLSISRELARANDGDLLHVPDSPGAHFELVLPATSPARPDPEPEPDRPRRETEMADRVGA